MKRMYLLCNAHIDPMWQWEWTEGVGAAISTFRVAAALCEQYDAFVFNHNESLLYQWIEEYEPALFEQIRELVQKGRWHIMGGWFVQPDCNIPHGESIVRQISVGRRYFSEKFGAAPTTAINFDPFGHSRGIVQIMAQSGYDSYIICRPVPSPCRARTGSYGKVLLEAKCASCGCPVCTILRSAGRINAYAILWNIRLRRKTARCCGAWATTAAVRPGRI